MKYYVVADVHGFFTELKAALSEKGFFEDKEPHKLIICGDLLDRGNEALEVQSFVLDLLQKDEIILIRGNHEDLLVELVENAEKWMTSVVMATHHWSNGTIDSVLQLTGKDLASSILYPDEFKKKAQVTSFYKTILPVMKDYFETEKHIFVHGWIPCDALGYGGQANQYFYKENWRESSQIDWNYARWYNGMEAARQGAIEPHKTIVCGHWHTSYGHAKINGSCSEFGEDADFSPYKAKGIIALDACTVHSHKVNCIVIVDSPLK